MMRKKRLALRRAVVGVVMTAGVTMGGVPAHAEDVPYPSGDGGDLIVTPSPLPKSKGCTLGGREYPEGAVVFFQTTAGDNGERTCVNGQWVRTFLSDVPLEDDLA